MAREVCDPSLLAPLYPYLHPICRFILNCVLDYVFLGKATSEWHTLRRITELQAYLHVSGGKPADFDSLPPHNKLLSNLNSQRTSSISSEHTVSHHQAPLPPSDSLTLSPSPTP